MKINYFNIIKKAKRTSVPRAFNFPSDESDNKDEIMNKPGNESSIIDPSSSSGFGNKERKEYPSDISALQEEISGTIPSDSDPEMPFGENEVSEYGQGISTDYGLLLHDDDESVGGSKSPLGINNTINSLDFKNKNENIFNMRKRTGIYNRLKNK